jgi:FMN phosphatase YigB (HAD superfamily)
MSLTLLLDLDDTLLDTNMEVFLPAYFQALAKHLDKRVKPDVMVAALMSGMRLMLTSEDATRTLQQVFETKFYPKLGVPKQEIDDAIQEFYDHVFPSLRVVTRQQPGARDLVEWALDKGHHIAIATDPLFPLKATYQRIQWAGLEPERFDVISSFETFHFSKSHPAYFAEILGQLGWPDRSVLMVGNDLERDLAPAQSLGLPTFLINGLHTSASVEKPQDDRQGSLVDLRRWLDKTDITLLEPSFKTIESILAILESTPAVLQTLFSGLSPMDWTHEPTTEDWAIIELICHLRDTEREVHHAQIRIMLEESQPFVPRPDAAVWAKQRKYLSEDGLTALHDFAIARLETLKKLKDLQASAWARTGRHAIFGPTNFTEVVSFMADHDRLHVQQAWKTLEKLLEKDASKLIE